jgi:hypothetical protein
LHYYSNAISIDAWVLIPKQIDHHLHRKNIPIEKSYDVGDELEGAAFNRESLVIMKSSSRETTFSNVAI